MAWKGAPRDGRAGGYPASGRGYSNPRVAPSPFSDARMQSSGKGSYASSAPQAPSRWGTPAMSEFSDDRGLRDGRGRSGKGKGKPRGDVDTGKQWVGDGVYDRKGKGRGEQQAPAGRYRNEGFQRPTVVVRSWDSGRSGSVTSSSGWPRGGTGAAADPNHRGAEADPRGKGRSWNRWSGQQDPAVREWNGGPSAKPKVW